SSVRSTSCQPVNILSRFHSLSPWRTRTSTFLSAGGSPPLRPELACPLLPEALAGPGFDMGEGRNKARLASFLGPFRPIWRKRPDFRGSSHILPSDQPETG